MDDLIRKRSATERLIIAKTLLETVLQDMPTAEPELANNSPKVENGNGDLISRQAAIEVLEWFDQIDPLGYTPVQIVRALPAAEPSGDLIRCRDCKHFHENVWGNEIGLDDLPIIVGHEACDAWGREWTQSFADGYCHMAERRNDEA